MELKRYQKKTLEQLQDYILGLRKYPKDKAAGVAFMIIRTDSQDRFPKEYHWIPEIGRSPFVCIKVPTGGGKTLIAVNTVGGIYSGYLGERADKGLVIWFVPSDAIRAQTLEHLRNRKHPYREVLDQRFNNAVKIFDLSEAKSIRKDDLADNLCILVSTLSAFRRNNKEWLKAFQDNGALMDHFEELESAKIDFLDKDKNGGIIYSLVNVIKLHNPLVIVDEGHNVQTDLSFDMLQQMNPSFVLEFTATPRGQSNVLVDISAKELKEEKMIKMPVYLANKTPWQDTIHEGIEKLRDLEKRARKIKGEYIRPIMLIQAEQEKESKNKVYVDKIYEFITEDAKIPAEAIAIQTSKRKELPDRETLLGKKCPIRFIITVNALREGWDCPFAYVLVSVSNLGARLSVEQTIGRIMRLPNASEKTDQPLNSAYIFASTKNFNRASEMVIKGLQDNGYEDIIPVSGGVAVLVDEFKRKIEDKRIEIPFINIKDGKESRKLDYIGDLIGNAAILDNQSPEVDFHPADDTTIVKFDIGREGELTRDAAGKLSLIYRYKDFTREDLLTWFRITIQRGFIAMQEMNKYLNKAVGILLDKHKLGKLSAARYQVKEAIENKIDQIVDGVTTKKFNELVKDKLITGAGVGFDFKDKIRLLNICRDNFTKHLYEKAGKMNKEELGLAYQLDGLDNVHWWFRNPEIGGFYIQGWLKGKFYPDFIVKTKKGNYFILEYKGEHLLGAQDAEYKEKIGRKWQELAGKSYIFELVEKNTVNAVMKKIVKA
ncbi:MAG: DEAD/DEAH box helicase family protein [Candidatus Omnitrophota bacterium]|nr:DEAD/DEAH box helicase family protein [Candidatus Omnitrophota bacterium]